MRLSGNTINKDRSTRFIIQTLSHLRESLKTCQRGVRSFRTYD